MAKSKYTGERLETTIYNRNTLEHLHRYAVALEFAKGKRVLDIACGEGYGSKLLADIALEVIGVDINEKTIIDASEKYKKGNLRFLTGAADNIPLESKYFDVVVSFETIEHHDRHDEMMQEIKRVLKNDGLFIISSPDKLNYSDKRNYVNQFHVKEMYEDEFKSLMQKYFSFTTYFYQKVLYGSILLPEKGISFHAEYTGNYQQIMQSNDFSAMFIVCIASNSHQINFDLTIFSDNLMHERSADIYKNSFTYKVGDLILKPFKMIKRLAGR